MTPARPAGTLAVVVPMTSAVPEGPPVEGLPSLEVRWIFPGQPDTAVAGWFSRSQPEAESREDTYLLDPGLGGLSVKVRAGRSLEVKMFLGSPGILDLGGRALYWNSLFERDFLERSGVKVTLVNLEPIEDGGDRMFEVVQGDATALGYADNAFDIVHSKSVVEHVGDWPRMEAFARETRRLAPSYYVQTPNFGFPIEPHFSSPFFHWTSEQARANARTAITSLPTRLPTSRRRRPAARARTATAP